MNFLFEAIALDGPNHFFYWVYQTDSEYFTEVFDLPGVGWHFRKVNNEWVADDQDN